MFRDRHTRGSSSETTQDAQRHSETADTEATNDPEARAGDRQPLQPPTCVLSDGEAEALCYRTIDEHEDDPNFPRSTLKRLKQLKEDASRPSIMGAGADRKARDGMMAEATNLLHSPYPEVRAVTDPEDSEVPVETLRAYFLGIALTAAATALSTTMDAMSNYLRISTIFASNDPGISIGGTVLQLVLAPFGHLLAWALPKAEFKIAGKRLTLNPGPWNVKEQTLATIMFSVTQGVASTYYVYLVQRLPQYYNQSWVNFGYEVTLALSVQFLGFGFAGLLRRIAVYPQMMLWPSVLPTMALNRMLCENCEGAGPAKGWRISQRAFFSIAFAGMFVWYWFPNVIFRALRAFNWMTWMAPRNFALAAITGYYGGMGFNPIAPLEWTSSGMGALVTPWFSEIQRYIFRVISGLIIIALYWTNYAWTAHLPINAYEAFSNTGQLYNVTQVMTNGSIDLGKYQAYGPAYFSASNVFSTGAWFAWYTMMVFSVGIKYFDFLSKCGQDLWKSGKSICGQLLKRGKPNSIYADFENDPHIRHIKHHREVPWWWFTLVLLASIGLGIAAVQAWPGKTPWWTILAVLGLSLVFIVPSQILSAVANISVPTTVFFRTVGGVWFAGRPEAMLLTEVFGSAFNFRATSYVQDQKLALYARLPPRAVFRAQLLAVLLQCFIFVGLLDWMMHKYEDGRLCAGDNGHFVCFDTSLIYATSAMYGGLGVPNLFKMYPVLPWCFLLGAVVGITYGLVFRYRGLIKRQAEKHLRASAYGKLSTLCASLSWMRWFDPTVAWAGALNWTGGNNLSHATNRVILSFLFMYHIKNKFPAWWGKYNYILEAALDAGAAGAAIVITIFFDMVAGGNVKIDWWGNTVSQAGVDWQMGNGNASLLPLPEKGYFGLTPDRYPTDF